MTDMGATNFYTDLCPRCENAVLVCDGDLESCWLCGYSRDWLPDPPLRRYDDVDAEAS